MGHQPDIPPPPERGHHHCPSPKNWSRPPTLLNTRSASRTKPNHRTTNIHMTKTSPFRPAPPDTTSQPKPPDLPRARLYTSWGLRWPQSNTTPENFSILLHRPPWMNNSGSPIRPLPHIPSFNHIFCHNCRHLPNL